MVLQLIINLPFVCVVIVVVLFIVAVVLSINNAPLFVVTLHVVVIGDQQGSMVVSKTSLVAIVLSTSIDYAGVVSDCLSLGVNLVTHGVAPFVVAGGVFIVVCMMINWHCLL